MAPPKTKKRKPTHDVLDQIPDSPANEAADPGSNSGSDQEDSAAHKNHQKSKITLPPASGIRGNHNKVTTDAARSLLPQSSAILLYLTNNLLIEYILYRTS